MFRRISYVTLVVCLATVLSAGYASASTVLYSTLGPNGQYDGSEGWDVDGANFHNQVMAMPFTPNATSGIADVVMAMSNFAGTNSPVSVFLESDNGGAPGSILAGLTQVGNIVAFPGGLVPYTCSSCPTVDAGTRYWLVAQETDPNSQQDWMWAWNDVQGPFYYNETGSATGPWSADTFIMSGFRVDGSTTPEPGTLVMLGSGVLGLAGVLRRKINL